AAVGADGCARERRCERAEDDDRHVCTGGVVGTREREVGTHRGGGRVDRDVRGSRASARPLFEGGCGKDHRRHEGDRDNKVRELSAHGGVSFRPLDWEGRTPLLSARTTSPRHPSDEGTPFTGRATREHLKNGETPALPGSLQ